MGSYPTRCYFSHVKSYPGVSQTASSGSHPAVYESGGGQLLGGSVWVAGAVPYPVDRSSHRARYAPETVGDVTATSADWSGRRRPVEPVGRQRASKGHAAAAAELDGNLIRGPPSVRRAG